MGQGDVLKVLEKTGKFMTAREVAEYVGNGVNTTAQTLRILLKHNEVELKIIMKNDSRSRCNTYKFIEVEK